MRWHAESDNLVLCAVLVELRRSVAAMAVKDKKPVDSMRTRRCIPIKVLYPLDSELICRPAVIADCENPVWREVAVPASLVLLTRQDHEGRETPARRVDTLDSRNPVSVTWLHSNCSTYYVRASNHLRRSRDAHHKASLVEVVGINILYTVRLARLLNELKPRCDSDRILTASALAVELPIPLGTKLRLAVDKARHPLLANRLWRWILASRGEKSVCHTSYVDDLGRKASSIKV